jgi:tellurite methyltransferase
VLRTITGFHADDVGDFVAELSCLHNQHVRHAPPFRARPWVQTADGRAAHIGTPLDCPLCDRAELPDGLRTLRTAGPFDDTTLPAGLRRPHRVAHATWGLLRVIGGTVDFTMQTSPPIDTTLQAGDSQPIPPDVTHQVRLHDAVVTIDFLVRDDDADGRLPDTTP